MLRYNQFDLLLKKVICSVQSYNIGIYIDKTTIDMTICLAGENKEMFPKTLIRRTKKVGLEKNGEKTKVIETLEVRDGKL